MVSRRSGSRVIVAVSLLFLLRFFSEAVSMGYWYDSCTAEGESVGLVCFASDRVPVGVGHAASVEEYNNCDTLDSLAVSPCTP